jgi:RNA-binding protein
MLTSKQRAFLRSQAQTISPIFQVGKDGVGQNAIKSIKEALAARELIKIHVLDSCPYKAKEVRRILSDEADCQQIQVIGNKITLFKQKKDSAFDLENLVVLK